MIRRYYAWTILAFPLLAWGQDGPRPPHGFRAVTIPSADVTLSFVQPGLVAEVRLREGDTTKADQILARLDTRVEEARLSQLKAEAENTTRLDASEASLAQKRVDLARLEKAAQSLAATDLEVQHAVLDVRIAELSLVLARFEHEQAQRKYSEGQAKLEQMLVRSPIAGVVEEVLVERGESANALDDVIRLVRIDPLWIDASLPLGIAAGMKPGQTVRVQYTTESKPTVTGKVLHVAKVADAASRTLKVRIEVPNEAQRPAGDYVWVIPSTEKP